LVEVEGLRYLIVPWAFDVLRGYEKNESIPIQQPKEKPDSSGFSFGSMVLKVEDYLKIVMVPRNSFGD
jgi:hypothetical protein